MHNCDVCGSTCAVEIVASGIAPVSYRKCFDCVRLGAEPIGVVVIWLAINQIVEPRGFAKQLVSFLGGRLIEWKEIFKHYSENRAELREKI